METTSRPRTTVEKLADLAVTYHHATVRADKARDELHAAIRAAVAAGMSQAAVARATGYSRERLRQIASAKENRNG